MRFEQINARIEKLPYTGARKGKFFYEFVLERRPHRILELGFGYGASTLYFAAALEEIRGEAIDTVDVVDSHHGSSLEELSHELGLDHLIGIYRENSSYTWFLKKKIEEQSQQGSCEPIYDLCFIDGPKDWTNDGAAFFMVDKLLRPGGWIIFDDYAWTYRAAEQVDGGRYERGYVFENMSEEEWSKPQVEAIYRLLVKQHPAYSNFSVVDDTLAIAQKNSSRAPMPRMQMRTSLTPSYVLFIILRKLRRMLRPSGSVTVKNPRR